MSWIEREALEDKPGISREEAGQALDRACEQVIRNLAELWSK